LLEQQQQKLLEQQQQELLEQHKVVADPEPDSAFENIWIPLPDFLAHSDAFPHH
jgi:hypothetical protein